MPLFQTVLKKACHLFIAVSMQRTRQVTSWSRSLTTRWLLFWPTVRAPMPSSSTKRLTPWSPPTAEASASSFLAPHAYSDAHFQVMSATMLRSGDCVVIISSSGRTRDLLDACAIARKNAATTIVITASGTPLASAGHMHLAADHSELCEKFVPMVSRLLHLLIIDVLATCVALRLDTGALQPLLREVMHNLRSKRYG